jgi:DNA (cytosine-5)-methyltransferase 1
MNHGSLFSGIGGFDLAAQWMDWENLFHCEWNEFGQRILKYYWPNAISYTDITKTDFTIHRGTIDILTGGFPCQPYSSAGKRLGKEDDRHLWPEMLRAIREIQPKWIVGENVFGLVNWNGGLVFDEVQADLEAEGYEVQPYILPACAVNAPHRRDRVWFVAYSNMYGHQSRGFGKDRCEERESKSEGNQRERIWDDSRRIGEPGSFAHSASNGSRKGKPVGPSEQPHKNDKKRGITSYPSSSNGRLLCRQESGKEKLKEYRNFSIRSGWQDFPTQSPVCNGDDGLSSDTYRRTIQNENSMDRNLVIKGALDNGRLKVDFSTGKIYSTRQRGKEGQEIELNGADCNGYIVHNIMYEGVKKQCRAHQIVWIAANGLYDKGSYMIDHINRDKKDNRLENLRLVDAQGNRDNATPYDGKLSQEEKDRMYFLHKEGNMSMRELAEDFGISKSRVHQLINEHSGLDGITFSKWRNESIKAGGNAIVPQVILQIFKAIQEYELTIK